MVKKTITIGNGAPVVEEGQTLNPTIKIPKMMAGNNVEAYLNMFECREMASWPETQWTLVLIPFLAHTTDCLLM